MFTERIEGGEPGALERTRAHLAAGMNTVVQFDGPTHSPEVLAGVDDLCAEFGAQLEVRFYGNERSPFDFRVLDAVPHVVSLTTNCLNRVKNVEALRELGQLERFVFGAEGYEGTDLLDHIDARQLVHLFVGESAKSRIDLARLSEFPALESLGIAGQTRGIDSVARVPRLRSLTLWNIPKKQSLTFLSGHPSLEELEINLGGRESVDEIASERLRELEIVWVRGFSRFPDLASLPALEELRLDRLAQLKEVIIPPRTLSALVSLSLASCKNLERVEGLRELASLEHLHMFEPKIDLEALVAGGLPASLKNLTLRPKRAREEPVVKARIEALGYEFG